MANFKEMYLSVERGSYFNPYTSNLDVTMWDFDVALNMLKAYRSYGFNIYMFRENEETSSIW